MKDLALEFNENNHEVHLLTLVENGKKLRIKYEDKLGITILRINVKKHREIN